MRIIDSIGYQQKHASYNSLKEEGEDFFKRLQNMGYINAELHPLKRKNDSLFILRLRLHQQYKTLKIYYPPNTFNPKTLKNISSTLTSSYFIISLKNTKAVLKRLNNHLANRGKPFNSVQLIHIKSTSDNRLTARLKVHHTQLRHIDSVIIKGYQKFPRAFIPYYIGIKKGELFSKSELNESITHLQNLQFASSDRKPEVLFTEDATSIYLYLKKENSNHFEGFLGFSTDEETQKLQLNGDLSLRLVNNLNFGESFSIHYKNDGTGQQHFNADLKLPFLFSTPFGAHLNLDLFRQDSTYTTNSQTAKLTYRLSPRIAVEAGYKKTSSNVLLDNLISGHFNQDYESGFFMMGAQYLHRNERRALFPFKTKITLSTGFGKRNTEAAQSKQQQVSFTGQHIFSIDQRNSFYVSNHTAVLFSENYIDNELFKFGGINSIRGIEENSLRASFYSSIQTEYRYLLSADLYLHSIMDYAYVQNARLSRNNNIYGIGFGLGMQTKAGLLKVAFANSKTNEQSFRFKNTKVHISLTAKF